MWLEGRHGVQLRNHATGDVFVDKLFHENFSEAPCTSSAVCVGSRMVPRQIPSNYQRSKDEVLQQAKEFLDGFFRSLNKFGSEEHISRLLKVHTSIEHEGSYVLTYDELVYGTQLAWRNAPRCIARVQWPTLKVFDARHVRTAVEMFDCIVEHIKYATNQGRLRSVITIFPPRTDGKHDFRVWNSQLISYAGYRNGDGTIEGDPANAELTDLCLSLGWDKREKSRFDILPLILQANGNPPEVFPLPEDIVMEIPITHPTFPTFEDLGLRWYALPAVANMLLDCGGLQFPGAPFNGWYMGTEIGARDLCDTQRYDLSKTVAEKLGLDTSSHTTLWKDTVLLEVNKAVLHSYQKKGVTTWDHHTASESFMQFYSNEMKTRGGCPADWIWLVPPITSSSSPLFHQEMALYFLKPSFEYQTPAWSEFKRRKITHTDKNVKGRKFRSICIAIRFIVYFSKSRRSKRPKLVLLYASQSGKAERFASLAFPKFNSVFQASIYSMADYDAKDLHCQQAIVAIVSTFGDGEPPSDGEQFKKALDDMMNKNDRVKDLDTSPRFAVLGLGSTSYDKFCAFANYVDMAFEKLGYNRLLKLVCADELKNQEKTFQDWLPEVINTFIKNLIPDGNVIEARKSQEFESEFTQFNTAATRFVKYEGRKEEDIVQALSLVHRKEVSLARISGKTIIGEVSPSETPASAILQLSTFDSRQLKYAPGDHIAIFPRNMPDRVQRFLRRVIECPSNNSMIQLQIKQPGHQSWENYRRIPPCSIDTLLTRLIDLACPPSQLTLQLLARSASDHFEKARLQFLSEDVEAYNEWVSSEHNGIVEVLENFPSVKVDAANLICQLSLLQPRYYSVSSSAQVYPIDIHLTVSLVRIRTKCGHGRLVRGLCTAYLEDSKRGDFIAYFLRSNPSFHLPPSTAKPLIWIAAGSGIAPFRSFWQQRCYDTNAPTSSALFKKITSFVQNSRLKRNNGLSYNEYGHIYLYYGCRNKASQLFRSELETMIHYQVINKVSIAFSKENGKPKVYVQDLLWKDRSRVSLQIMNEGAYIYVCGGLAMASQVENVLKRIIQSCGVISEKQVDTFFNNLKADGRYKTDVYST